MEKSFNKPEASANKSPATRAAEAIVPMFEGVSVEARKRINSDPTYRNLSSAF